MKRFASVLNYNSKLVKREKNTLPSKTIPDQSMSIREILARFARGIPITGNVSQYDDQEDLGSIDGVNFKSLDISEQHQIIQQKKEELLELKERHNRNIAEKQKAKIIREHEEKIKKLKTETATPLNTDKPASTGLAGS